MQYLVKHNLTLTGAESVVENEDDGDGEEAAGGGSEDEDDVEDEVCQPNNLP